MSASVATRALFLLGSLAACAPRAAPPPASPAPAGEATAQAGHAGHAMPGAPVTSVTSVASMDAGRRTFEGVCRACHSVTPPPLKAPPMSHVAQRYRRAAGSDSAAIARIVAFVAAPSAERSLMPAMVRERFGLMPALPLPAEQLRAVAAYVLTLADSAGSMGGHGRHER